MTRIHWIECFASNMKTGQAFVAISDGTTTFCAVGGDLDVMIADYASNYGFNSPGDVSCVASLYAGDEEASISDTRHFTIHPTLEDAQ